MAQKHAFSVESGAGIFLVGFSALVIYRWLFQVAWIAKLLPGSQEMGVMTPLLLFLSGVCCYGLARQQKDSAGLSMTDRVCRSLLILVPALILAEHLFNLNLGLDWQRFPAAPTTATPHPGRVSANASLAFLLAGVAISLMRRSTLPARSWALRICVYGVMAIAFAALMGYFLRIETMYRFAMGNKMLAPTAFAMSILGATLWIHMQKMADLRHDNLEDAQRRIIVRSIVILAIVAVSAGAAGFSVMRIGYEQSVNTDIRLLASINATALSNVIEVSLRLPKTIASRPMMRASFAALGPKPDNSGSLAYFKEFGDSILSGGLTGVAFYSAAGQLLSQSGVIMPNEPIRHVLNEPGQLAQLRWANGYTLYAENDVISNGQVVGSIHTEERMPLIDRLLADVRASSAATDILICGREGSNAVCAPSRFYPKPFKIAMYDARGDLTYPISHALVGESGVSVTADLRDIPVYAAYQPIGSLGLGMVVKTSVDSLYAPLRERFDQLVAVLIALVVLGTAALLLQVRPLAAQLGRERKRNSVIVETSTDPFIALGLDGNVTDWNRAAERTFGWTRAEVLGRNLADMIVPYAQRAAHNAGFARFISTGTGPVIDTTLQVDALNKDGVEVPIELSIVAYHNGEGYVANAFLRDISERKAALEKLSASELRLRTITDNLPVLITYIDDRRHLMFANATITPWVGVTPEQVQGKLFENIVGPVIYAERRLYMDRALAGERVEFEIVSEAAGMARHLHTVYLPDVRSDGVVQGFYTLTSDISDLKAKEAALSELARVDSLTGLPNRLQLNELLLGAVARSRRLRTQIAVMFLDIDHFKQINDSHGHATGDAVLVQFALRLKMAVRQTDTVARLSGDEFVVVLEGLRSSDEVHTVANKIIAAIRAPLLTADLQLLITTSIGIGFSANRDQTPADLLRMADEALYRAKNAGRNCVSS